MAGKLKVAVRWQGRALPGVTQRLRAVGIAALQRAGAEEGELSVLLCDDRTMELLNRHFRHKTQAHGCAFIPRPRPPAQRHRAPG
ncbi:MAG: hypothetical protein KatS3mg007_1822 [Thermoanaerobaculum sp.]|nr:MAG: hypothetical protein KatS3mg007_1822 [Thermoanaerobaculum sp.]